MFCQIKGTGSPEVNVVSFSLICEKLLDRPSLPNYGFCSCVYWLQVVVESFTGRILLILGFQCMFPHHDLFASLSFA